MCVDERGSPSGFARQRSRPGYQHPDRDRPGANWPTFDRTIGRSGVSITSPAPRVIRRSWARAVDGVVYAQPLILNSEVIIATENETVYALSERTGAVRWKRHLASPVTSGLPCGNITPSGITGTPAVDVATGRIVAHRPIDVRGSDPQAQQERGALVVFGSRVYVPFGGLYGDCSDYKGRVAGAPISGKGRLVSFTTPNQREAGIWAPAGESVRNDSLYVATGNGTPVNRVNDSDSVLRLSPRLRVLGRFTPANYQSLSANDTDISSTAPALLPGGLIFQIGKEGVGYVLDGTRLGGTGGQLASSHLCEGGFGGDAVDGHTVVFSCFSSLHAIDVTVARKGAAPRIRPRWSVGGNAGPPIIAGGVVWDVEAGGTLNGYRLSDGRRVFSASTAPVITDFPSLSASGTRLLVPEGRQVVCYIGI
jgi:hypothetical protein